MEVLQGDLLDVILGMITRMPMMWQSTTPRQSSARGIVVPSEINGLRMRHLGSAGKNTRRNQSEFPQLSDCCRGESADYMKILIG
jgi:hypothetical protein